MTALCSRLKSYVRVGGGLVIVCLICILPGSSHAAVACPSKDLVGHTLTGGQPGPSGPFICFYSFPGTCTYNEDGSLFKDDDRGHCPPSAVSIGESPTPVPALGPWGLTLAVIVMTSFAALALRRRAHGANERNQ